MANNTPTPATLAGSSTPTTATGLGKTVIADSVVAKVAGIAASTVPGVFALGGGAARALGAIRGAIGGENHAQGISVEVGEFQVAADVQIVAEYPVPLQTIADGVRSAVIEAVETLVGLEVTEVNVTINDVHIPSDDKDDETEARVQ
ncbi:Asp23/Gls24 family envelope stress response protein [Microbacteriaceae bacterium VKM Ac-2855]|nr:Asp23/Gls24 family envelope stress response protein [Microbacteriaceae bacterium VKM Ac-2855]